MSASTTDTLEAAKRYGKALLEVSIETNQLDDVIADAQKLQALFAQSPEAVEILTSPLFSKDEQLEAVHKILDHIHAEKAMAGFVRTLCENRRAFFIDRALRSFLEQAESFKNIQPVIVHSKKPLSAEQQSQLKQTLTAQLGKDVRLDLHVDPSLKGGLSLEINSFYINNTIQEKLNRYHRAMKGDA